jgi:DNA-binding XRE family transcriptional regulator
MSRAKPPNIIAIEALSDFKLRIIWRDYGEACIDLTDLIASSPALALIKNAEFFATAQIGDYGWTVAWGNDIELDADHLFRLTRYQLGESLPPDDFRSWRGKHNLSQAKAAKALGISGRMVKYYEDGSHMVPKTVTLACKGYDAVKAGLAA